jgi:hypothetical protein
MLDRIWWFFTGIVAGVLITVRALKHTPNAPALRMAAAHTGADLLHLAARAIRPPHRG